MWDVADRTVIVQLHTVTHARHPSKNAVDDTKSIRQQPVTGDKEPYEGALLACMRHMTRSQQRPVKVSSNQ